MNNSETDISFRGNAFARALI